MSRGLGIRSLAVASMIAGLARTDEDASCDLGEFECDGLAAALFWDGLGLYAAGTIDDIAFAPRKARKRNLWMAPLVTPRGTSFALAGRF